ncbi:MAG: GNAT family N-acetyltransferase [bacterium]|nr:GNAT family N-acetyltransferase [bacterium]
MRRDVEGTVRPVREDEIEDWCACPRTPVEPGFHAWLEQERSWVVEHHSSPRNLFVCEARGELLGKYDVPTEAGGSWRLWAPSVRDFERGADAMRTLCEHIRDESRRRGVHDVEVILEGGHPHLDLARDGLAASGFVLAQERVLVRRVLDGALPPTLRPDLDIRDCSGLTQQALQDLCLAIGIDAGDPDIHALKAALNPGSLVLEEAGRRVGLALCASAPGEETLLLKHLGVVPRARGRGVGKALLLAVLGRARERGSRTYTGSTAKDNVAMRGTFASVGCEPLAERFVFALAARESPEGQGPRAPRS